MKESVLFISVLKWMKYGSTGLASDNMHSRGNSPLQQWLINEQGNSPLFLWMIDEEGK